MNPQQQYPGAPAPGQQPDPRQYAQPNQAAPAYDFILNPQKPSKGPGFLSGGSAMKRLAIFLGGLGILVILAVIIVSVISGSGSSNTAPLLTVAQEQTELVRIASQGSAAKDQKTINLAASVQLSVTSDNQQMLAYMAIAKQKVDKKSLVLKQNPKTDLILKNGAANNTFDSTFVAVLQRQMQSYAKSLDTAYKANPGPKGKTLLRTQKAHVQLLYAQSQQ